MSKKSEYITGEEALAHIQRVLNCSREEAERQLTEAVLSGDVRAIISPDKRWKEPK